MAAGAMGRQEEEPRQVEAGPWDGAMEDPELDAISAQARETEEETQKLKEMQKQLRRQMAVSPRAGDAGPGSTSTEDQMDADARSVYVGNVDYGATAQELQVHFQGCGSVNRVTILCDKFSGHPKGFAYVEFADRGSARTALALDESLVRGRPIKVAPKRTNRPGISCTDRGFPGARFHARTPSPCASPAGFCRAFNSWPRGRGRVYRARARAATRHSPY